MNKKGFTLIELLAVIIILGLIAVITIPKLNKQLDQSKKSLAEDSALKYKKSIDEYVLRQEMNKNKIELEGTYNIDENGYLYNEETTHEISFSGTKPANGTLQYINDELQSGCITIDKYKVTFTNGEISNTEKGTCEFASIKDQILVLAQTYASNVKREKEGKTELFNIPIEEIQNENIKSGWIALIDGEIDSYSLQIGEYIVTLNDNIQSLEKNTNIASNNNAKQAVISAKVDSYVKNALQANQSIAYDETYTVAEMSGVTTNPADSGWIQFKKENSTVTVIDYSLTYGDLTANYSSLTNGNYVSTFGAIERDKIQMYGYKSFDTANAKETEITISTSNPTGKNAYLKYKLTNETVAEGTIPVACIYSDNYGGELCLKNNEYEISKQKILNYFGYDENTWRITSETSGRITRKNPSETITCTTSDSHAICNDSTVGAGTNDDGIANTGDNSANFGCVIYGEGNASCNW